MGKFEDRAAEIGRLVEQKQEAYGNSIEHSVAVIKGFLQAYRNDDGSYTIPEELLPHLLLQVRIIDKQNRLFNNPVADKMGESCYNDIMGYALLGEAIQEKQKKGEL